MKLRKKAQKYFTKLCKKAQKYFTKLCKKAQEHLHAQLWYVKHTAHLALSGLKIGAIAILSMVSIVSTVLMADLAHKKYLEHSVGDQILFVLSMPDSKIQGSATGFHVKTQKGNVIFVTNAHVCEMANDKGLLQVQDKLNSKRLVPRRVLEIYKHNDLCVVEPLSGYEGLTLADGLDVGEPVWAIGYPLGQSMNVSNGRVKEFGHIKMIAEGVLPANCKGPNLQLEKIDSWFFGSFEVCLIKIESVQTDVVIYGGNSGSPLLNMWGNVTGVVFAANQRTNWGSAVPLNHLKELLKAY